MTSLTLSRWGPKDLAGLDAGKIWADLSTISPRNSQ
jgi:hypothetical protein